MSRISSEKVQQFFQNIRSLGFFGRLFSWNRILKDAEDAQYEIESLVDDFNDLEKDHAVLKGSHGTLLENLNDLKLKIKGYESTEEIRNSNYVSKIGQLTVLSEQLNEDRRRIQDKEKEEINLQHEQMKETWKEHEQMVESTIKSICNLHQIEYIDKEKFPLKGKPDNSLKICDQFVIFDAKSPAGDNLDNFPTYLKNQTVVVKKYVNESDVHKQVFLVVPSNTLDHIKEFSYNMADYNVFVITIDALEPIILALRKIEEYEFAEQLSPEDRDNICRIIGKFAHATKRRIQIDNYFCNEFINLLNNCYELPEDIQNKAIEFEMADKMNPPMEKRAKQIGINPLTKEIEKNKRVLQANDIETTINPGLINSVPLYKDKED